MAYVLLPEAEADLDGIWLYTARLSGSIDIANRLIDRITEGFWLLGKHPYLGRPRSEDLRSGLRTFPIGEYLIVYQVRGEDAAILHVMRGSRDVEALLSE